PRSEIQARHEILPPLGASPAIEVLKDGNAVGSLGTPGRRLGDAVVDGARVAVYLDALESCRIWILKVLDNPEPAAVVEVDGHGLPHQRLSSDKADRQPFRNLHAPLGFVWGKALCAPEPGPKQQAQDRPDSNCRPPSLRHGMASGAGLCAPG